MTSAILQPLSSLVLSSSPPRHLGSGLALHLSLSPLTASSTRLPSYSFYRLLSYFSTMGLFSKKSKPSQSTAQGYAPPPGPPPQQQQYGAPQQQGQSYSGGGGYNQQPQYHQGGQGGYHGGGQQYAPPPTAPPPQQSVGARGREDPLAALSKYDTVFLSTSSLSSRLFSTELTSAFSSSLPSRSRTQSMTVRAWRCFGRSNWHLL